MKIREKIKNLFRQKPLTQEQLAARAEGEARASIERGNADVATQRERFTPPSGF